MKDGCGGKCRKKCQTRINMEDRQNAFKLYWNLSDNNLKWQCLINWTEKRSTKKIVSDGSDTSDSEAGILYVPQNQITYKLPKKDNSELITVCKKMFLDTLGKFKMLSYS